MNSIELDKYVRETLLAPLEQEEETLPPDKQLALCLMALERIYTSYFLKSDKTGAKYFQKILEALENALAGEGTISGEELDELANWCEGYVDKWESGRFRGWKQYAVEILFPDYISPFTEALEGICRRKNPFEYGDIYQIGVELCELYERDFLNQTEADQQTVAEYVAARHEDVAAVKKMVLDTLKLYRAKKATQKDYFHALDELEKACARYPEDKKRYWELRNGTGAKTPEDMARTRREAERVKSDILFLQQCGELPNAELLERLKAYRKLNILQ
ncbi:hypothetical protein D1641_07380 [Colidextribacter sp. OB.20]|uniref:hypothetical protein n=1 Tax=Colidextribacter sp. OB.20 TaxID=2304568 RepID=UPI00136A9B34|nr:hypothetical protein [Colidextribacter sp. OB.20]NBI09837.1 hypothetical protein [Colidextribacter sp. OB.20]